MKKLMIGAFAVLLPACSSSGTAPPTLPAVTVVPTNSPTSSAATTTLEPTTTTTVPPPTTTATTLPPTTTIPVEDQIKQAVLDYTAAYHACGVDPANCEPEAFTASRGPTRGILVRLVAEMVPNGLHFLPDGRGSYVRLESKERLSDSEAAATACVFDAGTVLGPVGPDGQPTVVNDQELSFRDRYTLYLEQGRWLVGDKRRLETLGEGDKCSNS